MYEILCGREGGRGREGEGERRGEGERDPSITCSHNFDVKVTRSSQ